ncbi:MAG: two-component system histidine kinase PnpS [bacterium]
MKISVRLKWMAAHLTIGAVVLLFVVIYLGSTLTSFFESRFENRWKRELELAKSYFESLDIDNLTLSETDKWTDEVGNVLGMRVTLIDVEGKVIGDSRVDLLALPAVENHRERPEVIQALSSGFGKSKRHSATIDLDMFYFALPFGKEGEPAGVVRIAVDASEIDQLLSQIHRLLWLASGLGLLLVFVIGAVVSKTLTNRIDEMAKAAMRFATGEFGHRLETHSSDELGELGEALNQMSTKLKRNITQLTRERDQFETILNGMVEGVVVTDLSGQVVLCNRAFMNIFHLTESAVERSMQDVFRNTQLLNALEHAMDTKKDTMETIELVSPVRKNLEAHIAVLSPHDSPSGTVVVFHDVTRLKQLEEIRRDFVANVSHELRTPLTAIKGYAETLLGNGSLSSQKRQEFLMTINKHTDRMAKLVEDLLTLSKLESVESETDLEPLNLSEIVTAVSAHFKTVCEKENLSLKKTIPEELPEIKGIRSEIEIVLENLIDNAIKYGGTGKEIAITVEDSKSVVRISIADKGIGIPLDDQPRIFERFYRVDKGRSRELGGTGLGLSIVKHIVQRHGGEIWVESEVGKGSTFAFTLPPAV